MNAQTRDGTPFVSTQAHTASDPFRLLVEAVKDYGIFMLDPAGNVSSWNPGAEKSNGYRSDEVIGRHVSCFNTAEDAAAGKPGRGLHVALEEGSFEEEGLRLKKDGSSFWAVVTITTIRDSFGLHVGFANVTRDITERKEGDEALRRSEARFRNFVEQAGDGFFLHPAEGTIVDVNRRACESLGYERMESIGMGMRQVDPDMTPAEFVWAVETLAAAGVAHDFNNLLCIINGYSELLMAALPPGDARGDSVRAISDAGGRAAGLTRQLLSFSRQSVLEPAVLDLNVVVREAEEMLRRLVGGGIVLVAVLDPGVGRVEADPDQIGQVLMNLAINARDAMPQGGSLTIETSNVDLDGGYTALHAGCVPGRYVLLAVRIWPRSTSRIS